MSEWILHTEDTYMLPWLKASLSGTCTYCGSPMMNYYNDDMRCTNRRCSNDDCSGMKASKGDFMFKLLGFKGIGFATCLQRANLLKGKSHVCMLAPYNKPTVSLSDYLRIHCFEGVDSAWEVICTKNAFYTLDELYEHYDGKYKDILVQNKELLYANLEYVNLKERPVQHVERPIKYFTIMITGTPIGFETKDDFINTLNEAMGGKIVVIHQKTKRQSNVDYLIREPGSTTRGKVEAAIKGGIPIKTSQEFIQILIAEFQKMESEK